MATTIIYHGTTAEGAERRPEINALRERSANFLTTLYFPGRANAPGSDEFGRTQNGNNNACAGQRDQLAHWENGTKSKCAFRVYPRIDSASASASGFPALIFQGRIRGSEIKDVMWFNPGDNEMSEEDWVYRLRVALNDAAAIPSTS
jgi:glycogen operon protein